MITTKPNNNKVHCSRVRRSRDAVCMYSPTGLNPVESPVSASNRLYKSLEYLRISVLVSDKLPKVTINPEKAKQ